MYGGSGVPWRGPGGVKRVTAWLSIDGSEADPLDALVVGGGRLRWRISRGIPPSGFLLLYLWALPVNWASMRLTKTQLGNSRTCRGYLSFQFMFRVCFGHHLEMSSNAYGVSRLGAYQEGPCVEVVHD